MRGLPKWEAFVSDAHEFKRASVQKGSRRAGAFALMDRYVPRDQTRSWSIVGSWLTRPQAESSINSNFWLAFVHLDPASDFDFLAFDVSESTLDFEIGDAGGIQPVNVWSG
jgi:hypothetical protein